MGRNPFVVVSLRYIDSLIFRVDVVFFLKDDVIAGLFARNSSLGGGKLVRGCFASCDGAFFPTLQLPRELQDGCGCGGRVECSGKTSDSTCRVR